MKSEKTTGNGLKPIVGRISDTKLPDKGSCQNKDGRSKSRSFKTVHFILVNMLTRLAFTVGENPKRQKRYPGHTQEMISDTCGLTMIIWNC